MIDQSSPADEVLRAPGARTARRLAAVPPGRSGRRLRPARKPEKIPVPPGSFIDGVLPDSHYAQLHTNPLILAEDVGQFVIGGLKRAERILVVAPPDHVKKVLDALQRRRCDPAALQRTGQLAVLDAAWTLRQVLRGGQPSWTAFRRVIERTFSRGWPARAHRFRAYSELAGVLWQAGRFGAALEIERLWSRLVRECGLPLVCGFLLDPWAPASYDSPLHEISRVHQAVVPTGEDAQVQAALETAGAEVLGESFFRHGRPVADGLPGGYGRLLDLRRHRPEFCGRVLERARRIFLSQNNER